MPQNEPPAELVEIACRVIAPFMEGGREFDQMPPDRMALRKWCREGMCSTNDATQDDALEAATAVLAAVTPHIEARVVGEIVVWLRERSGTYHGRMYGECEPNKRRHLSERSCSYSDIANAIERGDYKESQT